MARHAAHEGVAAIPVEPDARNDRAAVALGNLSVSTEIAAPREVSDVASGHERPAVERHAGSDLARTMCEEHAARENGITATDFAARPDESGLRVNPLENRERQNGHIKSFR